MHEATRPDIPQRRAPGAVPGRILALVIAAATAGCLPVTADNRPSVPAGAQNGALGPDQLSAVDGCVVHRHAANSLKALLIAAREAGVSLYANSCYRDFAGQVLVRDEWCAKDLCRFAARPGFSNHGWGKAVDFGTPGGMTFEAPAYRWLKAEGFRFGWNHPDWAEPEGSAPEPWHWEWVGDGGTLHPGRTIGPQ